MKNRTETVSLPDYRTPIDLPNPSYYRNLTFPPGFTSRFIADDWAARTRPSISAPAMVLLLLLLFFILVVIIVLLRN